MNIKITNEQIKEAIVSIELYLGKISVSGEDVIVLAECRNALRQLITMIPIENGEIPDEISEE